MRFRSDDEAAPLEVELFSDEGFGESEVSFDRPRTPWSPRRKAVVGAVSVAVLIGGAFALGGGDDAPDAAAPDTTVERATTTTDSSPTTTRVRPSTTTTLYTRPAQLTADPGWRVYLTDGNGVREFDPFTGELGDSEVNNSGTYGVVRGPDGPEYLTYESGTPYALVGDGTGWVWQGEQLVRRDIASDTIIETVPLPPGASGGVYFGQTVLGTTAEDRPVIMLDDIRSYEVAADGSIRRFAEGAVLGGVSKGQYVEHRCDEAGTCHATVHTIAGSLEIDGGVNQQVGISPSGTHAVAVSFGDSFGVGGRPTMTIYDVRSGPVFAEELSQFNSFGYFASSLGGWSPDGRFFFFVEGGSLQMFDSTDGSIGAIRDGVTSSQSVLAVV